MKKIFIAVMGMLFVAGVAFATVTVSETRSHDYMKNEGYSEETIKTVQVEANEYTPKPTNKFQKVGFKIWRYIDPSSPTARDDVRHDIKPYSSYSDL